MAITKIQSESLNLADDYAFTGTITGAGESNKPAFHASLPSNQSISASTDTVIALSTEVFDTDNCYNNTNYRFTPTVAGKYFLYAKARFQTDADWNNNQIKIRKNGSDLARVLIDQQFYTGLMVCTVLEANGSTDYFDFAIRQESCSSQNITGDGAEVYGGGYLVST